MAAFNMDQLLWTGQNKQLCWS